mgnify:CR=1 FL=1
MPDDETYFIKFQKSFIIFRPLSRLAFSGNLALTRYLRRRSRIPVQDRPADVENFLAAVGYDSAGIQRPTAWTPARPHRPTIAVLLLTSACNLRCVYCYADAGESPVRSMPLALARHAIDAVHRNAREAGADRFSLSFHGGGEPTLNWDVLRAAVTHARSKDLPCHISLATNGVWAESQREFIRRHIDDISLSCDGLRPVQSAQRPRRDGGDSFDAVAETIRLLDRAGRSYGLRMTVTPEWMDHLPDSVDWICRETGARSVQVEPTFTSARGRYAELPRAAGQRFVKAFLQAWEIAAAHRRTFFYSGAQPWTVTAAFCQAPARALVVTPEGRIVTCFEITDPRDELAAPFVIGEVRDDGALVVDETALTQFAVDQQVRRDGCRSCFCYWSCAGDCATRSLPKTGRNSIRCWINRTLTRELLARLIVGGDGCWRGQPVASPFPGGEASVATRDFMPV